jgi:hypothetical protein
MIALECALLMLTICWSNGSFDGGKQTSLDLGVDNQSGDGGG